MQAIVQKWGNSLGFRIPSLWAKDNNVKNGSKIEVIAEKGKIVILPQKKTQTCNLSSFYFKNNSSKHVSLFPTRTNHQLPFLMSQIFR